MLFYFSTDAEEAVELLVDDESPEAEFVVRGIHCHASLESTCISLTPQKSWKCMLGISVPRHSKFFTFYFLAFPSLSLLDRPSEQMFTFQRPSKLIFTFQIEGFFQKTQPHTHKYLVAEPSNN